MLAAVATILPGAIRRPPFWKHGEWYNQLGRAGRELLDVIFVATRFGEQEIKHRDFELAKLAGKGLRWVQKGLWQLLHQVKDKDGDKEIEVPIIDRSRHYGRKEDSYRVIKIIAPEMLPQEKPKPAAKPRKPRRPINKATPLTPDEERAHAVNLARAAAESQPAEPTAGETPITPADLMAMAAAAAKEREQEKAKERATRKQEVWRPRPRPSINPAFDPSDPKLAEVMAELEAARLKAAGKEGGGVASDPPSS